MKSTLKKIPLIGNVASFIYRNISGKPKFTTSNEYWEQRYKSGGNSGAGSYNRLAEFKADVLNEFVEENNINSVIEYGCGDGNQLKYFKFKSYTGFDVSQTIIKKCQNLYKTDTSKAFKLITDYNNDKADLTLSLDVIYHLIEDNVFNEYMSKLFSSSNKYVIVYSTNDDEHENNNIASHVKHRKFTNWVEKNQTKFKLISHIPNKYSYNGDNNTSSYADFYIFEAI